MKAAVDEKVYGIKQDRTSFEEMVKEKWNSKKEGEVDLRKGKLTLIIQRAELTRDTETFGKMDPYVLITFDSKIRKTSVKQEGGKIPIWNEKFEIQVNNHYQNITFKVFDEDTTNDDLVGEVTITVSELTSMSASTELNLKF